MDKRKLKKKKLKQAKSSVRLTIPPNRRHKSKKDYKRVKKVDDQYEG